jgi:hypothetical protein
MIFRSWDIRKVFILNYCKYLTNFYCFTEITGKVVLYHYLLKFELITFNSLNNKPEIHKLSSVKILLSSNILQNYRPKLLNSHCQGRIITQTLCYILMPTFALYLYNSCGAWTSNVFYCIKNFSHLFFKF